MSAEAPAVDDVHTAPKRISSTRDAIGKTFSNNKVRMTWTFSFGDTATEHQIVLTHSNTSGSNKLEVDGEMVHEDEKKDIYFDRKALVDGAVMVKVFEQTVEVNNHLFLVSVPFSLKYKNKEFDEWPLRDQFYVESQAGRASKGVSLSSGRRSMVTARQATTKDPKPAGNGSASSGGGGGKFDPFGDNNKHNIEPSMVDFDAPVPEQAPASAAFDPFSNNFDAPKSNTPPPPATAAAFDAFAAPTAAPTPPPASDNFDLLSPANPAPAAPLPAAAVDPFAAANAGFGAPPTAGFDAVPTAGFGATPTTGFGAPPTASFGAPVPLQPMAPTQPTPMVDMMGTGFGVPPPPVQQSSPPQGQQQDFMTSGSPSPSGGLVDLSALSMNDKPKPSSPPNQGFGAMPAGQPYSQMGGQIGQMGGYGMGGFGQPAPAPYNAQAAQPTTSTSPPPPVRSGSDPFSNLAPF